MRTHLFVTPAVLAVGVALIVIGVAGLVRSDRLERHNGIATKDAQVAVRVAAVVLGIGCGLIFMVTRLP